MIVDAALADVAQRRDDGVCARSDRRSGCRRATAARRRSIAEISAHLKGRHAHDRRRGRCAERDLRSSVLARGDAASSPASSFSDARMCLGILADVFGLVLIGLGDAQQHSHERRPAEALIAWKIGSAPERLRRRCRGTSSAASRPVRRGDAARPCKSHRCRDAPRDRL